MVICTVEVNEKAPQTIVIGRRGTYNTQEVVFDIGYLIDAYGAGTAVLAVKRSQDSSAYPAVVAQEDSTVTWTVSETDTYYKGAGECELMWYVDGGLTKTIIYPMVVMRDILSTSEEAPDAYQTWVDDLTALGAETLQNAQDAAQSASDAEGAKDDAVAAKEAAETAAEKAESASTHAPIIVNDYWYVWDETSQTYQNTGVKAEGVDGTDGQDGFSPIITVEDITGGHRVTITDKNGTQTVDVMDGTNGTDGTDGVSPTVTITTITGGHTVTITDADHPSGQSFNVMDGQDGASDAGEVTYDDQETYQSGTVGAELTQQKNALSVLEPTATSSDVGKFLKAKTVADGKVTEYEFGSGGSGGGAVDDVQINGTSILQNGVANIPAATNSSLGAVKGWNRGVELISGQLMITAYNDATYKAGTSIYGAVTIGNQHKGVFYGLAKAAGDSTQSSSANAVGIYTEDAKAAIHEMLNGAVTVSGTTPTIAAKSGITYICGEVSTLTITLPVSGIFDVVFESGSTPTVLTATGVTWMNGFDPTTDIEANKTYEINILNGYGVAAWT